MELINNHNSLFVFIVAASPIILVAIGVALHAVLTINKHFKK